MKSQIVIVLFLFGIVALSGCISNDNNPNHVINTTGNNSEVTNPASVYCIKQGYNLEIRKDVNGNEFGVCIFPNNSECEEWAFYRGECVPTSFKENNSTIAIIVDIQTYAGAKNEIDRFVDDLKKDTGSKIDLSQYPLGTDKGEIKSHLKELYINSSLDLAFLIGEIPTAEYFPGLLEDKKIPSDFYYYDIFDKCHYNEGYGAYDRKNNFCTPIARPFIIARITAPRTGTDGISMIKNYLDKDHAYRNGEISFDQNALVYPTVLNDLAADEKASATETLSRNLQVLYAIPPLKLYGQDQIIFADWQKTQASPAPRENYLSELSKGHQYVYLYAHGDPHGHDYGIEGVDLNNVNTFFVSSYSCNLGDYTAEDYAAGYYLFKGAMFVKTYSDYGDITSGYVESPMLFLMKEGEPIIESLKILTPSFSEQYLGDPTLKMPSDQEHAASKAKISVDTKDIDFGELKKCKYTTIQDCKTSPDTRNVKIAITNSGTETLGFYVVQDLLPDFSYDVIANSRPEGYNNAFTGPYSLNFENIAYEVQPGQATSFNAIIFGLVSGDYSGKLVILSNDPKQPLTEIPYKIKIVD